MEEESTWRAHSVLGQTDPSGTSSRNQEKYWNTGISDAERRFLQESETH